MAPGRKRKAAESAAEPPTSEDVAPATTRRRSGRTSSSAAATKSRYFDHDGDGEPEVKGGSAKRARVGPKSTAQVRSRVRRAKKPAVREDEEDDEDDGDAYKHEHEVEEAFQEEVDDEIDEHAPPKTTFIPLPKMRDVGDVKYEDGKLHPNTLLFLKDLKANNQREWLKSNDGEFRRALKDWETFVETMTLKIVAADETIPELPFKDVNFRIYRDIRFSKSPLPYKTHFSAAWSRTGRKGPYACYYMHCEPGGRCFVGGGLWHPEAAAMARLRASIDERPDRWRAALTDPAFRRTWLSKAKAKGKRAAAADDDDDDDDDDDYKALQTAFADQNKKNALKTKPKGFDPNHRDITLLKLLNFTVTKPVPDSLFTSKEGQDEVAAYFSDLAGFVTHLNRTVMPDPGDDDSDDD